MAGDEEFIRAKNRYSPPPSREEVGAFMDIALETTASVERWNQYFDSTLHALIDYEITEESAKKAVRLAAIVADEALSVFEERWAH